MKVVFLLEAGIPNYRNFLFEYLNNHPSISELLVLHTGRTYDGKNGNYQSKKIKFIGSNILGFHIGVLKYLYHSDVIISSYNLRIITCWLPSLFFRKKWIFWGKGLGDVESPIVLSLRKMTSRWFRYLLVYNEVKRQEIIEKLNVKPEKVIAYQNSIQINHPFDYQDHPKNYFLYFGRIQERKGLIELIRSYKAYVEKVNMPRFKLRIVGDGIFKDFLINEVADLNISKWVEFFPGVYNEIEIIEHFKEAVFYVSPFNVGLSVINSFACGVPVLTCDKPQVGPEFYYLTESNSIIVDDVSKFSDVFFNLDQNRLNTTHNTFDYYTSGLHHSIMLNNFIKTILKIKNEQA